MEYFGDTYLKFTDFMGNMSLNELIQYQLNTPAEVMSENELGFYINSHEHIINSIKCVRELAKLNPEDKEKQEEILKKYKMVSEDFKFNTQKAKYIS